MTNLNETAQKLLDAAELLTKTRGFNAFSYKDLQREVGVKTSTIHYYFASKTDLANSLTDRFLGRFEEAVIEIETKESSPKKRLRAMSSLFSNGEKSDEFCLCGMLASDILSLSDQTSQNLRNFFELNEKWISKTIKLGQAQGEFSESINHRNAAYQFLAALEGGMLIARVKGDSKYIAKIVEESLRQFSH